MGTVEPRKDINLGWEGMGLGGVPDEGAEARQEALSQHVKEHDREFPKEAAECVEANLRSVASPGNLRRVRRWAGAGEAGLK